MATATLLSIGDIAQRLGIPNHRVEYIIKTRRIDPVGRVGHMRAFPENAVARIKIELDRIRETAEELRTATSQV